MAGHAQEQPTLYYLSFPIESQLLAVCGNPSRLTVALACRTDITQQQSTRVRSWIAILGAAGELTEKQSILLHNALFHAQPDKVLVES